MFFIWKNVCWGAFPHLGKCFANELSAENLGKCLLESFSVSGEKFVKKFSLDYLRKWFANELSAGNLRKCLLDSFLYLGKCLFESFPYLGSFESFLYRGNVCWRAFRTWGNVLWRNFSLSSVSFSLPVPFSSLCRPTGEVVDMVAAVSVRLQQTIFSKL